MDYVGGDDGDTAVFGVKTSRLCLLGVRTNTPHQPSGHPRPNLVSKVPLLTLQSFLPRSKHRPRNKLRQPLKSPKFSPPTLSRTDQCRKPMRRKLRQKSRSQSPRSMTPSLLMERGPRPSQATPPKLPQLLEVRLLLLPVLPPQLSTMC
ncbi:hypothetical protein LB505_000621 [Fusarium chuoi]|nr:hypothetical protein LB505_000621 [Fusarium chuoi]